MFSEGGILICTMERKKGGAKYPALISCIGAMLSFKCYWEFLQLTQFVLPEAEKGINDQLSHWEPKCELQA